MIEHLVRTALFGDDPAVHEKYPVRDLLGESHLMGHDPVSYTHLDVYKRQAFSTTSMELMRLSSFP